MSLNNFSNISNCNFNVHMKGPVINLAESSNINRNPIIIEDSDEEDVTNNQNNRGNTSNNNNNNNSLQKGIKALESFGFRRKAANETNFDILRR